MLLEELCRCRDGGIRTAVREALAVTCATELLFSSCGGVTRMAFGARSSANEALERGDKVECKCRRMADVECCR